MVREDYSQSSVLSTLVGKPTNRYRKLAKNVSTLRSLTDPDKKPNNRLHYSLYPQIQREYQATITQLTNLDFYSPIVRIVGENPVSHIVGTPYTDEGIEINDYGSTLTSTVSTVDDNVFGIYKVIYTASDGINDDTVVYRTVKVGLRPDVTINGDNPYKLEKFNVYQDSGITINDSNSSLITTVSTVNNTEVGIYTVNYTVSNPAFTEVYSRTVRVEDTIPPVITISGDNPYTLERFDVYTDPGATVDLGSELTNIDLANVQNTNIGTFDVVYTAYDGNTTVHATRTVNVVDTVPPVITILDDNPYTLERFDPYVDPGATVDQGTTLTTDLTAVNNTLPHGSSFVVTYTASDGNTAHDVTQTRTVNIVDRKPPVITLLGDNPYEMQPGIDFRDVDPLYEVDLGTSVSIDYSDVVTTDNSVFYVWYRASDGVNPDTVVSRRVAVADTLSPIVTIIGDNPYTLERYAVYVDPGATTDTEAGSRFASTVSTVNNTAVGSYTVTYDATDDINANTIVQRIVNVVDRTAPIVTLNGASSVTLERYGVFSDIDEGVEIEAPGSLVSVDTSQLDNTTQGTYTVTYNVVDDQNNANVITREVVVQDNVPPVVTLNNESVSYTLERYGDWSEIDPGVTVDRGSYLYSVTVDNATVGPQVVTYTVKDGTNTTNNRQRIIDVVDTVAPVGSIANPSYQLERLDIFNDPGVENLDAGTYLAGTDTSNVDNTLPHNSTFDVIYDLGDGTSNTTLIRTVTVVDNTPPSGDINNPSLTLERFGVYNDPVPGVINLDRGSYIAGIDLSNVDNTLAAGSTFDVIYDLGDDTSNTTLIRTVTVVDTTPPSGDINNPSFTLERFGVYNDPVPGVINLDQGSYIAGVDLTNVDNTLPHNSTFDVIYDLGDGVNNTYLTRTVTVVDTNAPSGSIANPSYQLERFAVFNDPGVENLDAGTYLAGTDISNVDNTLSHNSTFDVIYDLGDGVSNTTLIRTVTVVDTNAPSGSIANPSYQLERFAVFNDPGVENLDAGTYLASTDTSSVDNTLPHNSTFDVIYDLGDGVSNTILIRTVTVVDTTQPSGSIANPSYQLERFTLFNDPGVENLDAGTYLASTDTSNVDNTLPHNSTFDVIYDLGDGVSNTTLIRTVTVVDTTRPSGSIVNPSYQLERFAVFNDPGVENLDAGTYLASTDTSNVDNTLPHYSTFDVIYDLGDGVSNTTLIRTVTVVDTTPPVITLVNGDIGTTDYTVERSTTYTDPGATADGGETVIVDTSSLNMDVVGTQVVRYSATDSAGNIGTAERNVIVEDTVAPVASLIGADPFNVYQYTDFDDVDPGLNLDVGSYIVSKTGLNTNVVGNQTLTYNLSDGFNNNTITRAVTVKKLYFNKQLLSSIGRSVGINYSGNRLLVGSSGEVNLFTRNTQISLMWSLSATYTDSTYTTAGKGWGQSVSRIDNNNNWVTGIPRLFGQNVYNNGAVMIMKGNGSKQILTNPNTSYSYFGISVEISRSGNYVIVGALNAAYAIPYGSYFGTPVLIRGSGASGNYGVSVSISENGDTAVVGSTSNQAAYVFTRSGSTWTEEQKIHVSQSYFGADVELSADGNTLAVTAYAGFGGANSPGRVYVYVRSDSVWTQQADIYVSSVGRSASSISIDDSGNRLMVGVPHDNNINIYSRKDTNWNLASIIDESYIANVGLGLDCAIAGNSATFVAIQKNIYDTEDEVYSFDQNPL